MTANPDIPLQAAIALDNIRLGREFSEESLLALAGVFAGFSGAFADCHDLAGLLSLAKAHRDIYDDDFNTEAEVSLALAFRQRELQTAASISSESRALLVRLCLSFSRYLASRHYRSSSPGRLQWLLV